jgi:hypothetical protein
MPAPKENQFWKLRGKHGRKKLFSNPEQVWEIACEYFQWCDDNPIPRVDVVRGGDYAGTQISADVPRPYSLYGLCLYMGITQQTFLNYCSDEKYKDFFDIFTRIRETIRDQKLSGAMAGNYNGNIVAKDLGLGDKLDITSKGNEIKNVITFGGKEVEV